ncbi:MAG: choice-of-anchor D domain-containing protein, partial [Candidatus Kapaibacterium sp.]
FVSAPDTIDFGDVIIGSTRGDSLAVITAIGNAGSITSRAILGANVGDFSSPDALTVPQPVPGCGSSATRVRFSPLTLGVKTARLEFTLQGLTNPLVVYLKGRGVRPRIVGDRLHRFDTLTCDNEAFDTITITNNGDATLQIDSVAVANFLGFFSVVDPQLPMTIAPFGFHKFILRGRVVSYGDMGARLYFYTNDPDFQDSTWTLDVRMYKHNLEYQPTQDTTIVIPSGAPGQVSRKSLVIVNSGTVGQRIEEVTGEGSAPNIKTSFVTPFVVRAGDSATIEFTGTANDTIARCRRFRVLSQPCDRERFITVCYQAVEGDLVLPSTLTYRVVCGELVADNVTLENSGNADLQIDSIRLEGSGGDRFSYSTSSPLPLTIPPSGKEGLSITFQGGSSRGTSAALLLLFRKDNTIDTVRLEGNVVGPELLTSPSQIDLGLLCPDDLAISGISLENVGEADAQVGAITFETSSGTFALIKLPSTIAASASDSLYFSFRGDEPGRFNGFVFIQYEPCGRVDTVKVVGEIYAPALEIDPSEIDLGQVPLGRTRVGQVDLWNRSSEDVNVTLSRVGHPDLTVTNPGSSAELLVGNASLQLTVSVTPTSVGFGRDTIKIFGVGYCNETLRIPVQWNGVAGGPYVSGDIDVGDILCDAVVAKSFYLYNGSDETIEVDSLVSSDQFSLRVETVQAFPASIATQDSLEVTLYIEGLISGDIQESLTFFVRSASGKLETVTVQVSGRRLLTNSTFSDSRTGDEITSLNLPSLYSCRSAIDTQIVIHNSGNLTDTLDLLSLDPTSLTITSSLPLIVEPKSSAVVDVHVERNVAGSAELLLEMESRVCPSKKSLSINVAFFEDEVRFPEKIDFDLVCVADTVSLAVMLENLLPEAVSIESITLTGDSQFSFGRSVPTFLPANGIDSILLQVKPESESFYNGELVLQLSSPCRREIRIPVSAAAVDCPKPDIRLRGGNVIGRWGETVRLPVMIEATRLEGIENFSFNLRAAKNLLDLRDIRISSKAQEWFELAESAYDADSGKLTLTIKRTEKTILPGEINQFVDTLLTVEALVLRGDEISTPLDIEPIALNPEGTIVATDGEFFLEDYCDAHGRLLHITGELSLKPVSPNPVSDRAVIEYELPFSDRTRLSLFDARGVLVRTLLDEVLPPGRRQTELEITELPSGQYTISLEIGLQRLVEPFIVRK